MMSHPACPDHVERHANNLVLIATRFHHHVGDLLDGTRRVGGHVDDDLPSEGPGGNTVSPHTPLTRTEGLGRP